jgi:hypothetical protein
VSIVKYRFVRQHLQKADIGNLSDDRRDCDSASEVNPVIKKRKLESSGKDQPGDILERDVVGDLAKRISSLPNVAHESGDTVQRNKQRRDGNHADTFNHNENSNNLERLECDVQMTHDLHESTLPEAATTSQCDFVSSPLPPQNSENFGNPQQVEKRSNTSEFMLLTDIFHQGSDEKITDRAQSSDISPEISIMNSIEENDETLQPRVAISSEVFDGIVQNGSQTKLEIGQLENLVSIEEDTDQSHEHNQDVEKSNGKKILSDFFVANEVSAAEGDTKSYATLCQIQSDILKTKNDIPQFVFSFKSPLSEFRGTLLRMLRDVVDLHSILHKNGTGEFQVPGAQIYRNLLWNSRTYIDMCSQIPSS